MGQIIQLIDSYTKENVNYEETSLWHDGTPMDDTKVDNVIFRKKLNKYYAARDFLNGNAIRAGLFGVSPDNPDNSEALQKAINYASSYKIGKVLVSAGTFKFGSPVYLRSRVAIEGLNAMRTMFTSDNDIAILTWFKHVEFVDISGITFTNNVAGQGKGISNPYFLQSENEGGLPYMSKSFIRNCFFRTNLKECVEGNILATKISGCIFGYDGNIGPSHRHLNLRGDLAYALMNLNYVENCMFTRAKGNESCYLAKGASFRFSDCDWELNQSNYTVSIEGVKNVIFDHCWWETHGYINQGTYNSDSKYLIYSANSPAQSGTSSIIGNDGLTIRSSNLIMDGLNLVGVIELKDGSALSVNIHDNIGSSFDGKNITNELPTGIINTRINNYYSNRFIIAGGVQYSTIKPIISGLLPVVPSVSTKGFTESTWFVGWTPGSPQGWGKTDITIWQQTADVGYFGNTMRITNGASHNSVYMVLPVEFFKGKKVGIRALGKCISGTPDLGIGYRVNVLPISSLTRPSSGRFNMNPTELYAVIDIPSDVTSLAIGLYQGGQTAVHDVYAFDFWIINDNVTPTFSL